MLKMELNGIGGFKVYINRAVNRDNGETEKAGGNHIHKTCEIYVNLSGDVSFMVENNIYPVKRGEAIITRPFEQHHCIYRSEAEHEHFWILFESDGNERLFDSFFNRNMGEGNRVVFNDNGGEKLIDLCERLFSENGSELDRYTAFLNLIQHLDKGAKSDVNVSAYAYPLLRQTLDLIDEMLPEAISISQLAKKSNISVNTLERWFKEELDMTPMEFILRKRLARAVAMLRKGENVQRAGMECGFGDISYFIKLFKRYYGTTPHKFSKMISSD